MHVLRDYQMIMEMKMCEMNVNMLIQSDCKREKKENVGKLAKLYPGTKGVKWRRLFILWESSLQLSLLISMRTKYERPKYDTMNDENAIFPAKNRDIFEKVSNFWFF